MECKNQMILWVEIVDGEHRQQLSQSNDFLRKLISQS